jgi:hypothetical protein
VVRGLSAVLAVLGAALAYFLIAPSLGAPHSGETAVFLAGAAGLVAVGACGLAIAGAWDEPFVLLMLVLGAGIVGASLTDVDAPAVENVTKAVAASALGLLFAFGLRSATAFLGVALLVAGIDLVTALTGPADTLQTTTGAVDALGFAFPMWGVPGGVVEVGISSLVFLGFFAGSAWRFGFRRTLTTAAMLAALVAAVALAVKVDRTVPATAALSLAVLLPNLDRIAPALRAERRSSPIIRV